MTVSVSRRLDLAEIVGMREAATIEWVPLRTEGAQPLALSTAAGIPQAELSSDDVWTSIRLEQHRASGPGELPEGYLPRHVIAINRGDAMRVEVSWLGEPRPTKHFVAPGHVSVFPAMMPYVASWFCCENQVTILIEVEPEFVTSVGNETGCKQFELRPAYDEEDPFILHLGLALRAVLQTCDHPNRRLYGETLGTALSAHLLQKYGATKQAFRQYFGGLPKFRLRQVMQYIDENLEATVSLLNLAKVVQMSVYHFVRLFKQSTGLSPHQYILKRRIELAKSLLQDHALPISEVALRSGFGSQSSFSRAFQRRTYFTPRSYRNRVSDIVAF